MHAAVIQSETVVAADQAHLAVHRAGEGPPVVLLHGFLSSAALNWIAPGIAAAIVDAGFHAIMPDVRGHGRSLGSAPPYPKDILADDVDRILTALGIQDFALVGYSLGARTAARLMARGASPRRLILSGMGDVGLLSVARRQAYFEDAIRNGAAAANSRAGAFIQSFMHANGISSESALAVLASQIDTSKEVLASIRCPTLVLCGERDEDNGSSTGLAALIPNARLVRTPGDHLSAVGKADFRDALVGFLREDLA